MGTNEILGIKSIAEYNKKGLGENIGMYLKEAWYFETFLEKLILVVLGSLGLWKIWEFIF